MSWIECVVDSDYEIFTEYPYQIRKKSNKRIVKESIMPTGYIQCNLNRKTYYKHRIIAEQFIPNPDPNKNQVDHIDRNPLNNNILNLRWVSHSENQKNKSSYNNYKYEYVNDIDDECILVDTYNNYTFENYYFDVKTDTFYFYNGINYRKLKINYTKYDTAFVCARDINNKKINIYYSIFKKQYGLI